MRLDRSLNEGGEGVKGRGDAVEGEMCFLYESNVNVVFREN